MNTSQKPAASDGRASRWIATAVVVALAAGALGLLVYIFAATSDDQGAHPDKKLILIVADDDIEESKEEAENDRQPKLHKEKPSGQRESERGGEK